MHGDMGLCIGIWHYGFMHGGGFMHGDMALWVYEWGYGFMYLDMGLWVYEWGYGFMYMDMGLWVYEWGYRFLCTGIVGSNNSIRLSMYIGLMSRDIFNGYGVNKLGYV